MKQLSPLIALATATCAGCAPAIDGRESGLDKQEWSILQGREYDARQFVVTAPTFSSAHGHVLLVVPSTDGSKNIWIMLSPKSPPFYKQMPQGTYVVSRTLVDVIAKQGLASSTVQEVLASHIAE
jgi:hypothetical protein